MDAPYWKSGWFGYKNPEHMKFFRFANLVTDRTGFTVGTEIVDHENYEFTNPQTIAARSPNKDIVSVNKKGVLCSHTIYFPTADVDAAVLQLINSSILRSKR